MKIKVHTNLIDNIDDDVIDVVINSKKNSKQLQIIVDSLLQISDELTDIIGFKNNTITIINVEDIICVYSDGNKDIICKTIDDKFKLKWKLYELEELLPHKNFIRISNSCIINIKHVKNFDTQILGSIVVNFKDGSKEYVSKRKVSQVMAFLKNRR